MDSKSTDIVVDDVWIYRGSSGQVKKSRILVARPSEVNVNGSIRWASEISIDDYLPSPMMIYGVGPAHTLMNVCAVLKGFWDKIESSVVD